VVEGALSLSAGFSPTHFKTWNGRQKKKKIPYNKYQGKKGSEVRTCED